MTPSRVVLAVATVLLLALALAARERRMIGLALYAWTAEPSALRPPPEEPPEVAWFDDYYTVEAVDARTWAIGEPRFEQQNYNYLIAGERRAVLFDSGPGRRDIRAVVESLTDLPVTAVPSHLHYDHVGNHPRFERVALLDLPHLRGRASGGLLRPTRAEHLGFVEDVPIQPLRVAEWWAPGSEVDLGGRRLRVLPAPGHTPESLALLDVEGRLLFSGDFLHPGEIYAFLPGSSLADLRRTARALLEVTPLDARILGGHRVAPPGAPVLRVRDLMALLDWLERARAGDVASPPGGFWIHAFPVNENVTVVAESLWLADWE